MTETFTPRALEREVLARHASAAVSHRTRAAHYREQAKKADQDAAREDKAGAEKGALLLEESGVAFESLEVRPDGLIDFEPQTESPLDLGDLLEPEPLADRSGNA